MKRSCDVVASRNEMYMHGRFAPSALVLVEHSQNPDSHLLTLEKRNEVAHAWVYRYHRTVAVHRRREQGWRAHLCLTACPLSVDTIVIDGGAPSCDRFSCSLPESKRPWKRVRKGRGGGRSRST